MSIAGRIKNIEKDIPLTMLRDRQVLSGKVKDIWKKYRKKGVDKSLLRTIGSIEKRAGISKGIAEKRLQERPSISFPENLPITPRAKEICETIEKNQVVIISGETGSGKSTQIPKICIESGCGLYGKIGCTQPRRIAATTIARRISDELGEDLGKSVGYKIRFREKTDPHGYIKIMTDGILLVETQSDPLLYEYDTLIIDEAHERSLNIDFLLGFIKTLLPKRPELKVIITSATLDTEKFSKAFGGAPIIEVSGRMYPVEVEYMPIDPLLEESGEVTYVDMAVRAVEKLKSRRLFGDILIFMPTEQDILETCDRLEGRNYPGTNVLPLFARLPAKEQGRVYSVSGPKIVVATNVAETSLTIPGIKYVIDTGLARISQYLPRTRTSSLPVSPISQSSADQRKGRCGRVQKGLCIRLYPEDDYSSRPQFTPPEIMRSNLAEVILRMIFLKLGHPGTFPFVDRPNPRSIKDGFDLLVELGALNREQQKEGNSFTLTDKGKAMARMPLDPKISRMIIEARKENCIREVAVIASGLSIQDPRGRPVDKADIADRMHAPFKHTDSDFLTLFKIWDRYHIQLKRLKTQNKIRKYCMEHFLSFPRMREWASVYDQIRMILKEQKVPIGKKRGAHDIDESIYAGIHKSILSGFLSNIAVKKEKNIYTGTRGREVMIFPGSSLFNKSPAWIVAAEMVQTSRLFARTAARIDIEWLEAIGKGLCKSSYFDPHWEKKRGKVMASEQVTLYGLVIVSKRPVSYGPIDPEESSRIFVRSALVKGELKERFPFLIHNMDLVQKYNDMEDKIRRRGILVSEEDLAVFYAQRLDGVYDIRTLKERIKKNDGDDFLKMKPDDILLVSPEDKELEMFPDELNIGSARLKTSYKYAPGKDDDGVTIKVPEGLLRTIRADKIDWSIPGLFEEKVNALLKGLPKRYRKKLVPVSKTMEIVIKDMERNERSLLITLADFIYKRFNLDIPADIWSSIEVPDHLRMRVSVVNHKGKEVRSSRDIASLMESSSTETLPIDSPEWEKAKKEWERDGIIEWDIDEIPESLSLGHSLYAYPGFEPDDNKVNLRLFGNREEALKSHKKGVGILYSIGFAKDLKYLKKNIKLPSKGMAGARYFGGKESIEDAILKTLLKIFFEKDIRTKEEFSSHEEKAKIEIFDLANDLKERVADLLDAYHNTRAGIYEVEESMKKNLAVQALCVEIRRDMENLVPENFMDVYDNSGSGARLNEIPRYLKALEMRAQRGAYDPAKDQIKINQVQPFIDARRKMTSNLSPFASKEKIEALESFKWMIEEFKVSLFAQELKTRFPISAKRLKKKLEELERMV